MTSGWDDGFVAAMAPAAAAGAAAALAAGGFAKGVVGFALPLIALSVAGSFLPYEVTVALLIVPMLVSNLFQALRNGARARPGRRLRRFWWLNLVLVVMIALSAQLVVALSDRLLFGLLGVTVSVFGASQLAGWQPRFPAGTGRRRWRSAVVGGFFGGISGIWGPPMVMYLLAAELPKVEMVRVQSLSFLLGSVVLLLAHLRSGVLNPVTLPASAWLVLPTMAAMFAGYRVHDRLDQERFRKVTLVVLVLTGPNLLRRAVA